jgi:hexosaminidase
VFLWPRPASFNAGVATLTLGGPFKFVSTGSNSPLLTDTFERFEAILQPSSVNATASGATITGCDVNVRTTDLALDINTSEAYNLTVPGGGARCTIEADSVFGAMRGLETLAGLFSSADRTFTGAPLSVQDKPRYPYRGLMQDTSRHFLPVSVLLDHLEAMSAAKLNVFHWHLTDLQSWPLDLKSLPLATKAAWGNSAVYSSADIASVVDAARRRGIRVIPELDMPAVHFSSVLKGYPSFGAGTTVAGTTSNNLDPTNEAMWTAITAMFAELAGLFPDEQIHVGFDEVDLSDWNTTAITAWMEKQSMTGGLKDVESYFLKRVHSIVSGNGKKLTIWDDPVGEGVKVGSGIQLQVWNKGMDLVSTLSAQGYQQVYSSPFYLDHLSNSWGDIYGTVVLTQPFSPFAVANTFLQLLLQPTRTSMTPCRASLARKLQCGASMSTRPTRSRGSGPERLPWARRCGRRTLPTTQESPN